MSTQPTHESNLHQSILNLESAVFLLSRSILEPGFAVMATLNDDEPMRDPRCLDGVRAPTWLKDRWCKQQGRAQGRRALETAIGAVLKLTGQNASASLTHHGPISLAIACLSQPDLRGIGVDLERFKEPDGSNRPLSPKLIDRLLARMGNEHASSLEYGFFELWVLGEALFKANLSDPPAKLWPSPVQLVAPGAWRCELQDGSHGLARVAQSGEFLVAVAAIHE